MEWVVGPLLVRRQAKLAQPPTEPKFCLRAKRRVLCTPWGRGTGGTQGLQRSKWAKRRFGGRGPACFLSI